jgi:hypothetical protein
MRVHSAVRLASVGCALAVLLLGCRGETRPASGAAAREWFPLERGARWVYEVQTELGSVELEVTARGDVALRDGTGKLFVMDELNRGPTLGFVESAPVGYRVENGYIARFQAVDYDADGKLRFLGQDVPTWFLPLEPKVGHRWFQSNQLFSTPESPGAKLSWAGHVVGISPLEVPAGQFAEALQIHIEYRDSDAGEHPTMVYDDWYAKGVGLLRSRTHDPGGDDSKDVEIRLLAYGFPEPGARAPDPEPAP